MLIKFLSYLKENIFRVLAHVKTSLAYNSVTVVTTEQHLFTGAFQII